MVFDVPASSGGALSILKDFYNQVIADPNKSINWIFILSTPKLNELENVKIIRFPWIKKSWIHRLYFDHFVAPKLVRQYNPDKILSFQNVIISHTKVPQILYVHQSLPFIDYKFSFIENKLFWIYQNVIDKLIKCSIKKAQKVIVQTNWMKKACMEQTGVNSRKIKVISPTINLDIDKYFVLNKTSMKRFFYPAGALSYKNHRIVIEACKKLKEQGISDYKVVFTLAGNENDHVIALYREVKELNLPVDFVGSISREEVFEFYTKSILIFPSYIETFGLPMLEARLHKTIVFASDCPFSKEILEGYENAYFFDPFNANELKDLMEKIFVGEIKYKKVNEGTADKAGYGWSTLLNESY